MEVHPLQRFPSSEIGRGSRPRKADEAATAVPMMEVKTERNQAENDEVSAPASPSINLRLQIGRNPAGSRNERTSFVHRQRESILTVGQLQELQQQVLIHKHLAAGLLVPTHLLVPIWKNVARTLGSNINGINKRYHSFIGYSSMGFDYKSMIDPEPGRCRRTDGKKWRCSRNTVSLKKYCERHMHRGQQRSRKPVEATENISQSKKILLNNPDRDVQCPVDDNKTKLNPFPCVKALALGSKTFSDQLRSESVTETLTSSKHGAAAIVTSCADATKTIRMIPGSAPSTTVPTSINLAATTSIPTSYIIDLKDGSNMNNVFFRRNDINVKKIPSPGFGFSPNSALQVSGCSSSKCDGKINLELEPEGVEERMGRSGDAGEMLFRIKSIVDCICTEVQRGVRSPPRFLLPLRYH